MAVGTETAWVAAWTGAAALVSKSLGVPADLFFAGVAYSIIGCSGKMALDWARYFKGKPDLTRGGIMGSFGASLIGSPMASVVALVLISSLHIAIDKYGAIVFVAIGYGGPELMFTIWNAAYSAASDFIRKRFNMGGGPPTPENPNAK